MLAAKQEVLNLVNQIPDDADMDEIMYRLYLFDKDRQETTVENQKELSDQAQKEMDAWFVV